MDPGRMMMLGMNCLFSIDDWSRKTITIAQSHKEVSIQEMNYFPDTL